jgi:glycerol-3-phosphate dehydrogenase
VQDARLVALNAVDARERGADIRTRTRCVGLQRHADHWLVELENMASHERYSVRARALVNAAGPWVEKVLQLDGSRHSGKHVRLVKGSHIVVPKLFDHAYPYIFQNGDGRVLFAIPYEREFTLLGTTDLEVRDIADGGAITAQEVDYICRAVDEYLERQVTPEDVVWSYAGARPLYDDDSSSASKVTRDYKLDLDLNGAPILSVFGGKITTYRDLAQHALRMLAGPMQFEQPDWTARAHLPGGDIENADFDAFLARCRSNYPWLLEDLCCDYARNYGTRIDTLLQECGAMADLGHHFDGPLYEREVAYLMDQEFAQSAEDVLWRRSKKGLFVSQQAARQLETWMQARAAES